MQLFLNKIICLLTFQTLIWIFQMAADLMEKILEHLAKDDKAHSLDLAQFFDIDHQKVIGAIKSLENIENVSKK